MSINIMDSFFIRLAKNYVENIKINIYEWLFVMILFFACQIGSSQLSNSLGQDSLYHIFLIPLLVFLITFFYAIGVIKILKNQRLNIANLVGSLAIIRRIFILVILAIIVVFTYYWFVVPAINKYNMIIAIMILNATIETFFIVTLYYVEKNNTLKETCYKTKLLVSKYFIKFVQFYFFNFLLSILLLAIITIPLRLMFINIEPQVFLKYTIPATKTFTLPLLVIFINNYAIIENEMNEVTT